RSRDRAARSRALWYDQSRRLVATPCGDTPFQREFVRHGINPAGAGLARICYSPRRALFPRRLGLVNYRTNEVIMVEPPVSAAFVPRPRRLVQASAWQANCFLIYSAVDVRRTSRSGARRDHGRRV